MSPTEFKIEVATTKKKYTVTVDPKSESGFTGLPFEWERLLKDMKIQAMEVEKYPMEVLMGINFIATAGFSKMYDKKTLY